MSHKKLVVSIFLSFLCFLGSMTSAWADNGESDYRDENNTPAEAYEGEYAPENSYPAQEYYPENQGYYSENQEYYPENQEYYPENQEYYPENQEYYPENQEYYPENQGDQGYYPETQGDHNKTQNRHIKPWEYSQKQGDYEEAPENESLFVGKRPWQQGFDMRWQFGFTGLTIQSNSNEYTDAILGNETSEPVPGMEGLGGYLGLELGYRWKYGGVYAKLIYAFLAAKKENDEGEPGFFPWPDFALLGKFYVPFAKNWELVLDAGVGRNGIGYSFDFGAGASYHIGDTTVGCEFIYIVGLSVLSTHLFLATFVVGYTFSFL